MRVRIHQPLWGGFPKHWAKGPVGKFSLTENESLARDYATKEAEKIVAKLAKEYPNAIVVAI